MNIHRGRPKLAITALACAAIFGTLALEAPAQGQNDQLPRDSVAEAATDLSRLTRYVDNDSSDDQPEITKQYAVAWGVESSEADRRLQSQISAGPMIAVLREHFPRHFAGGWINEDSGIVHVAFTASAPSQLVSQMSALLSARAHLTVTVRQVSSVDLQQYADNVRGRVASASETTGVEAQHVYVSARETTSTVVVEYVGTQDQAFEERLRQGGSGAVDLEFVPGIAPIIENACLNPSECPDVPARGGIAINSPGGGCTTAFMVRNYSGVPKMLTAGHCMSGTDEIYFPNGKKFGRFESKSYNGADRDVAVFDMVSEYESVLNNGVFRTQTSPNYPIRTSGPSGVYEGANMCKTGRVTYYRCGTIFSTNYNGSGAFAANICARSGDSGGPGFNLANSGLGIQARGTNADFYGNGTCGSTERSIFVYVNYNASLLNTSVYLGT